MNSLTDLISDIQKILDCGAFEFYIKNDDETVCYVPYMMNDALECYYKFSGCLIRGDWEKDNVANCTVEYVKNESKHGLILRQGTSNTFTIWFDDVIRFEKLYQYHRIAHVWVKGNEKWRRLVYIVGTMHDKVNFMGAGACCEEEIKLAELMGFAPFRFWTPIHESLDEYYSDTKAGISAIYDIAIKLNDKKLIKKINAYTKSFANDSLNDLKIHLFARYLAKSDNLYTYINNYIEEASLKYQERIYSSSDMEKINTMRLECTSKLLSDGYLGQYPYFKKGNKKLTAYEEHPFVMHEFEYENFDFKINLIEE